MSQAPARENDSMTRLRATAAHTIPQRPPIQVTPGQQVQAGQQDTDWPAFVFITTSDGAGWVPRRHLDTSSDPAVVTIAYDTTELATTAGEELTLINQDDPSGWAWVRNAAGLAGTGATAHRRAGARAGTASQAAWTLGAVTALSSSIAGHKPNGRCRAKVPQP